mmetsp:Transcript_14158/g.27513  ORF Transcript_14158/g.27513 Transcript_14158/m.27513 type:complete len:309 (+) Transcript_14158:1281-2207(+)
MVILWIFASTTRSRLWLSLLDLRHGVRSASAPKWRNASANVSPGRCPPISPRSTVHSLPVLLLAKATTTFIKGHSRTRRSGAPTTKSKRPLLLKLQRNQNVNPPRLPKTTASRLSSKILTLRWTKTQKPSNKCTPVACDSANKHMKTTMTMTMRTLVLTIMTWAWRSVNRLRKLNNPNPQRRLLKSLSGNERLSCKPFRMMTMKVSWRAVCHRKSLQRRNRHPVTSLARSRLLATNCVRKLQTMVCVSCRVATWRSLLFLRSLARGSLEVAVLATKRRARASSAGKLLIEPTKSTILAVLAAHLQVSK